MSVPQRLNEQLSRRAAAVIPYSGGIYGHMSTLKLPSNFPQFYERGLGTRMWDVDGNEYIDLMCAWGPMLLGHRHPGVEAAARAQLELGDALNGPTARMVELAELMTDTVSHGDWAMFVKNGTDATTVCTMTARAATGRSTILVARGAYHGSAPWCTPGPGGVTREDRANLETYEWNDLASVEAAVERCGGDVAGILACPFRHDAGFDQELVDPDFARGLRAICDREGAALILDDVRCTMRLNFGGSWEPLGVEPDLSAFGKGMANGFAISAVLGVDGLRDAARKIYVTGSFWYSAVAMAAGIATLETLRDGDGIETMRLAGQRLRDGLARQAADHGVAIRQTGPVQMPYLSFQHDPEGERVRHFAAESLRNGVMLHNAHNWFLSAAHTSEEIDLALERTGRALESVAQRYPEPSVA